MYKLCKLIEASNKNRKIKKYLFHVELKNIFEITKTDGNWLCQENKLLYNLLVESQSKLDMLQAKLLHNRLFISLSEYENQHHKLHR